jgi:hypothetical protein
VSDTSAGRRSPALERLAQSRERIRATLREANGDTPPDGGHEPSALMKALLAIPGVHIVVDALRHWWAGHPMRMAGLVATHAARTVVRPMAKRNPYALMVAAAVAGGLIFWIKPWRGLIKPALLAGLMPQILSRAVAHVPMESWISALLAMATQGKRDAASSDDPAVDPDLAAAQAQQDLTRAQRDAAPSPSAPGGAPASAEAAPQRPSAETLH